MLRHFLGNQCYQEITKALSVPKGRTSSCTSRHVGVGSPRGDQWSQTPITQVQQKRTTTGLSLLSGKKCTRAQIVSASKGEADRRKLKQLAPPWDATLGMFSAPHINESSQ